MPAGERRPVGRRGKGIGSPRSDPTQRSSSDGRSRSDPTQRSLSDKNRPASTGDSGRGKSRSRSTAGRWRRDDLPAAQRSAVQAEYDGPPIPDDIVGTELDRSVTNQLKSLPEKLAARVARHLVAAGRLIDTDPETAYRHTMAARARAARVGIVREACGEAAYAAGRFKEALGEFQAARRMSGSPLHLPMMADCERALGRPQRALALAKDAAVDRLDEAGRIEMMIVESGARRDLGDVAAAVRTLESRELRSRSREPWVARLRYAYADALLADGQTDAAREWFERAAAVDAQGHTDAAERLAELDGLTVYDAVDGDTESGG